MTECATCGQSVPDLGVACLACGESSPQPKRSRARFEVSIADSEDPERTIGALARLTNTDTSAVRRSLILPHIDVAAELTATERERLLAAFAALGLRFREPSAFPLADETSSRFVIDAGLLIRLGSVAVTVVLATLLGLSWLPYLAVPVAATLIWSRVEQIPRTLTVPLRVVEERLGGVDRAAWQEACIVRRGIRVSQAVQAALTCSVPLCSVLHQIRHAGLHLLRPDFAALDQDAHTLLRRTLRLAAAADRVAMACDQQGGSAQHKARLAGARKELFGSLDRIAEKARALHGSLVELGGLDANNQELSSTSARVAEIQLATEAALEVSTAMNREFETWPVP